MKGLQTLMMSPLRS